MDTVPSDPSPRKTRPVGKMRKPSMVKRKVHHPKKVSTPAGRAHSTAKAKMAARPVTDRERAELDKKLEQALATRTKLEKHTEHMNSELGRMRVSHNYAEQERDRLGQMWRIARQQLADERRTGQTSEQAVHRMRTTQAQHIMRLRQHIRLLTLHHSVTCEAATQTDVITTLTGQVDSDTQTVEEMSRERAAALLRMNDAMLSQLIAELEQDKLNAQSDLKYAVVQLEQRMREDAETQMRRFKEEKQRQLEEISTLHAEQLKTMENTHLEEAARQRSHINYLQEQLLDGGEKQTTLNLELKETTTRLQDSLSLNERVEGELRQSRRELADLNEYRRRFQRDTALVEAHRREVLKYRDINEILLGEFKKVEAERDELLHEMEKNVDRMERVNRRKNVHLEQRIKDIEQRYL